MRSAGPVVPVLNAVQLAEVPVPIGLQVHVHGPDPETAVAVPVAQRLVVGAVETVVPFAEPQVPLVLVPVPSFALQSPVE